MKREAILANEHPPSREYGDKMTCKLYNYAKETEVKGEGIVQFKQGCKLPEA